MKDVPTVTSKMKTLPGAPASLRPRRVGVPRLAIVLYYLYREQF
jgi:hypothetical protein